jgi:hypothetical protein
MSLQAFARESMLVLVSTLGLKKLIYQQSAKSFGLFDTFSKMTGMTGPHSDEELAIVDNASAEVCGGFVQTHVDFLAFMDGIGLCAVETISALEKGYVDKLVATVASMFVSAANGIQNIICERDIQNNAGDELPPVLPMQIVKIDMRSFCFFIAEHKPRLKLRMSASKVNESGVEFSCLLRAYREETDFKVMVDSCTNVVTYLATGWSCGGAGERFPDLRQFCGDLPSTFPNTATVDTVSPSSVGRKTSFKKA